MAVRTKEHGMAAHPEETKYQHMIIGTRQKLSCCEEWALTLFLDDRKLEQAQEEHLLGLDIDPILSWLSNVTNLRKKLLTLKTPLIDFTLSNTRRFYL